VIIDHSIGDYCWVVTDHSAQSPGASARHEPLYIYIYILYIYISPGDSASRGHRWGRGVVTAWVEDETFHIYIYIYIYIYIHELPGISEGAQSLPQHHFFVLGQSLITGDHAIIYCLRTRPGTPVVTNYCWVVTNHSAPEPR
jgi:hypothetical protein